MIITESYKPSTQVLSKQSEGAAKQKTQTKPRQAAQPAYQVDISPTGKRTEAKTRLEKMFNNIASSATLTCTNWTDEQKKEFASILEAAGQSGVEETIDEDAPKNDEGALTICEEGSLSLYSSCTAGICELKDIIDTSYGDGALLFYIDAERELENTGLVNPLHKEYQTVMDKYFTAASAVDQGGANTFRQLNLEFAGVAFAADEKDSSGKAAEEIAKGKYTWNEYNTAKGYASQLQQKAGVYVRAGDFDYPAQFGNYDYSFSYTYNGTIATAGIKQLDLMASHREAESVWIKAAQGDYKNSREVVDALKNGGFDEAAKGYEKMLSAYAKGKGCTIEDIMQSEFNQNCSSLWEAAVGADKFKEMQAQYGNNKSFTYSASELDNAYRDGQTEAAMIRDASGARDPELWYVTADGQAHDADGIKNTKRARTEAIMPTPTNQLIIALQKELKDLRKQQESLKSGEIDKEKREARTQTINTRIQTIQMEISSYLATMNKK